MYRYIRVLFKPADIAENPTLSQIETYVTQKLQEASNGDIDVIRTDANELDSDAVMEFSGDCNINIILGNEDPEKLVDAMNQSKDVILKNIQFNLGVLDVSATTSMIQLDNVEHAYDASVEDYITSVANSPLPSMAVLPLYYIVSDLVGNFTEQSKFLNSEDFTSSVFMSTKLVEQNPQDYALILVDVHE